MWTCWQLLPDDRPDFHSLEATLKQYVVTDYYLTLDVPFEQFNLENQDLLTEICNAVTACDEALK